MSAIADGLPVRDGPQGGPHLDLEGAALQFERHRELRAGAAEVLLELLSGRLEGLLVHRPASLGRWAAPVVGEVQAGQHLVPADAAGYGRVGIDVRRQAVGGHDCHGGRW